MADQREILSSIYALEDEIAKHKQRQNEILDEAEKADMSETDIHTLHIEYEDIGDLIEELEEDVEEYKQMLRKLEASATEIGACGFACDGFCQTCKTAYDSWEEVFTGGDY